MNLRRRSERCGTPTVPERAAAQQTKKNGSGKELHRSEQGALRQRVVRSAAYPVDQRPERAQARHAALRRASGRGARQGRGRPGRGDAHGGQSGGLRREDRFTEGEDRACLRTLRRHARRPARGVAHGALRAGRNRRPHPGARRRRRQGPALDARQGLRGDVCDGHAALQRKIHARG